MIRLLCIYRGGDGEKGRGGENLMSFGNGLKETISIHNSLGYSWREHLSCAFTVLSPLACLYKHASGDARTTIKGIAESKYDFACRGSAKKAYPVSIWGNHGSISPTISYPYSATPNKNASCKTEMLPSWQRPCKGKLVVLFEVCYTTSVRDVSLKIVRFVVRT